MEKIGEEKKEIDWFDIVSVRKKTYYKLTREENRKCHEKSIEKHIKLLEKGVKKPENLIAG